MRHAVLAALVGLLLTLSPVAHAQSACTYPARFDALIETVTAELQAIRTRQGLPALVHEPRLSRAAMSHACWMARTDTLSHRGAGRSQMTDRIEGAGYAHSGAAENIARGYDAPEEVLTAWMRSSGHRRNLLNRSLTEYGLGYAVAPNGRPYWVIVMARPR
ncbi:CAP domain-containing protein [Roseicyclus sp. F158]|uniref:CAP domain-containing protein n=1 Tax=Tropicimonas omnivorans TaxID=3075590 RepID=A0ABU3DF99_9RHOB|nr:CAP domain-containing protein [Roseicyclus sp. F158]MDT0682228.1 CAP domain-containing protein [Roseicyclus sp. F158]